MTKKANKKFADKLEKKYGHLFDRTRDRSSTGTLTKDDKKLLDGECIMEDGESVCRIDNVWIVC